MTLNQFLDADEEAQKAFFQAGAFIGEKTEDGYAVICHQVDGFYVEYKMMKSVWKENTIIHYLDMRCSENTDLLQPYLDKMDIKFKKGT